MKAPIISILLALSVFTVNGGMRGPPAPHAVVSSCGSYVFTIAPEPKDFESIGGVGVCYRVREDGTLDAVWRTSGWYSENLMLSSDGKTLIRIGSWQSYDQDHGPIEETLAIAFYREGKLTKRYIVSDLVRDLTALVPTTAGYFWSTGKGGFMADAKSFSLETVDGIDYTFSLKTGDITEKSEPGGADQPATATESKSGGKEKPQPEAEERCQ